MDTSSQTHSQAMRASVHGPIRPKRESVFTRIAGMVRNRPEGEPHPMVGMCFLLGLLSLLILALIAADGFVWGNI